MGECPAKKRNPDHVCDGTPTPAMTDPARARAGMSKRVIQTVRYLNVYQCPIHTLFVSLVVESSEGSTRIVGGKCCPAVYGRRLAGWKITKQLIADIMAEIVH